MTACGTTYELPVLSQTTTQEAQKMFLIEQSKSERPQLTKSAAISRFNRVSKRIEQSGERYCEVLTAEREDFDCNVDIAIDKKTQRVFYLRERQTGHSDFAATGDGYGQ